MLSLVIATTNNGKIKEFQNLLADLPVMLKSLDTFGKIPEAIENGQTFAENAELKAGYYALQTDHWTLADDSGLEVEALNGAPGIYSARYAGVASDDRANINKLLSELEKTKDRARKARFICEMAIADQTGLIKLRASGICSGSISLKPLGNKGFGYDPVFIPNDYSETFGELQDEIKAQISHRSLATQIIIQKLSDFLAS